jgi:hypothetical protein
LNAMRCVLHKLNYTNKDADAIGLPDPLIVCSASDTSDGRGVS